jgi:hypothetical protein
MKQTATLILSSLTVLLCSIPAFSAGFGIYGSFGGGKTDMLKPRGNSDYRVDYSQTGLLYGGGMLIESEGTADADFHNRFSLCIEGARIYGGRYEYQRLIRTGFINTFAFRIAGNDRFRFWIGPLIGAQLITGLMGDYRRHTWSSDKRDAFIALAAVSPPDVQTYALYYLYYDRVWRRTFGTFIPVGMALGLNIALGESASFMIEGGFRCGLYVLTNAGFNYEGYGNMGFVFGAF